MIFIEALIADSAGRQFLLLIRISVSLYGDVSACKCEFTVITHFDY